MEEIGEQEADDLERHADHCVPHKGEDGADGQAVDVDFVAYHARSQDGSFPVRRGCIGGGGFVGLDACVSAGRMSIVGKVAKRNSPVVFHPQGHRMRVWL